MVKVYNTLTRRKEELIPLSGNKINMYACGITVSGEALTSVTHIRRSFMTSSESTL